MGQLGAPISEYTWPTAVSPQACEGVWCAKLCSMRKELGWLDVHSLARGWENGGRTGWSVTDSEEDEKQKRLI